MIHLEIDLQPENDNMEQCITDAIGICCADELDTLQDHLNNATDDILGPTTEHMDVGLPGVLYRLTSNGKSTLGRLLAGEAVTMSVCESTGLDRMKIQRNNVLCNVLTLLLPLLSVNVLAEIMSAWALTSSKQEFQQAVCEYYMRISRDGSAVEAVEAVFAESEAHRFLRSLFCMLTANRRRFSWFGQSVRGQEHRSDHLLTKRYGLSPPDLDSCRDRSGLLDVCYAEWYLSTHNKEDIADAFATAIAVGSKTVHDGARLTKTAFVEVLSRRAFDILQALAPNCAGCDSTFEIHSGGGCGTRELVACLLPIHALQLLEMLVCDQVDEPNVDVIGALRH